MSNLPASGARHVHVLDALPYLGVVLLMGFRMFGRGGRGGSVHHGHREQEALGAPASTGGGEGSAHAH